MLEGPPLSTVRACLFNTVATTLHFWSPSPPCVPRGHAMPLCLQSTYHKVTNLQLLQMCKISWLVVELKDLDVWSNLLLLIMSSGNRLLTSTVQKRYCINVWNIFTIIWTVLTHKCCHYWGFPFANDTVLSISGGWTRWEMIREHILFCTVTSKIRTATMMMIQLRLLGCYGSSTGKQLTAC
jgi:hypothetical protein